MKNLLMGVVVAVVLALSAGVAESQYEAFHWWTDHGWQLVYECGIWSEPWTVTPGADPKVAAVLSKPRSDGRMDFCFVSFQTADRAGLP